MAVVQQRLCDLCRSVQDVSQITVVWGAARNRPWEADICKKCYNERFAELAARSRRPSTDNVRPQHKVKKTTIGEANL